MKPLIQLALLLLISTAMFTSCKKAVPKQTRHIPKNAVFVAGINTKSLQYKLEKNQATLESIVTSLSGSDSSVSKGKQEWEELKKSGLDLQENFYVSVVRKGGGMGLSGQPAIVAGVGLVKDASMLEAYIKKKQPASEVRKEKSYNYITSQGENMIAWSNDLVITMMYQQTYQGGMEYDSVSRSFNLKRPGNTTNELKAEMDTYFNLKEDASVAAVPEFRDLMQEKADAVVWANSSASLQDIPLPLPTLKELFGNAFTAATLNFADGKIDVKSKSYFSKELRDIFKKYTGSTVDLSLIENYPSGNINAFMAFAFNPQMINAIVRHLEIGGIVDGFLTKTMGTDYTLPQLLKVIKGDFALILSDIKPTSFGSGINDRSGEAKTATSVNIGRVLFNAPIGDNVEMQRLMDKLVQNGMLVKINNEYKPAAQLTQMGLQISIDDKNLFVSTDSLTLSQYKQKAGKANLSGEVLNDFKGKSGIFYVNIQSILNAFYVNPVDSAAGTVLSKAKETFRDIKAYAENFNGKNVEGHFELRLINQKENSLTSLLNFINTAAATTRSKKPTPKDMDSSTKPKAAINL